MRVLSVTGYDEKVWTLFDTANTSDVHFTFIGKGNTWAIGPMIFAPLPSEFKSLIWRGTDCYHLRVVLFDGANLNNDVEISTEVRCFGNGYFEPTTIRGYNFVIPAGTSSQDFYRRFLCGYLPNEESYDCSLTSSGGIE